MQRIADVSYTFRADSTMLFHKKGSRPAPMN